MKIAWNARYLGEGDDYLFVKTGNMAKEWQKNHPSIPLVSLGIGDVTRPLPGAVVEAMVTAARELGEAETFRGYPPEGGYPFLKRSLETYYRALGVDMPGERIYIGDGAKCDLGNLFEILGDTPLLLPDPVYPVWRDAAALGGRRVEYFPGNWENGFLPTPCGLPKTPYIICLCSPNNPTGAAYSYEGLKAWVDFAIDTGSLILFDSAYSAFADKGVPKSVYEIKGADTCSVEIGSFSKMAGFTGVRCSWSVFPLGLVRGGIDPGRLWSKRQATKFNGVGYVVQRGAEAALGSAGRVGCNLNLAYYRQNADTLMAFFGERNIPYTGGIHAPYLWCKVPGGESSFDWFRKLLDAGVVTTPGSGFGKGGEGWIRLTAFASHTDTETAICRMAKVWKGN